jgi:hypothetical protein
LLSPAVGGQGLDDGPGISAIRPVAPLLCLAFFLSLLLRLAMVAGGLEVRKPLLGSEAG